ncbi:MAG: DUF4384 domain-containing protein [Halioglobus sp.]|nr:DUF4384 domain-containing protein [Halioglobus sp.]
MRTTVRLLAATVALLLGACSANKPAPKAEQVVQPAARPVHNLTSFSRALSCMDDLLLDHGVQNVIITSQGIPDATGEIRLGTKDMLISAISRMSTRSGAFSFVDYDQRHLDINALQDLVGFTQDFRVPNYYIRGAITQFDEQILSNSKSGGVSLEFIDAGKSANRTSSIVSIDLNIGNLLTRQILPGTSANNSIVVSRDRASSDVNGSIDKLELGFSFSLTLNRSEGMHQSVRTLLELSVIESLGKLTQVPYWQCLGAGDTSTAMLAQARGWFEGMSATEQLAFVQHAMRSKGLYNGPVDGRPATPELRSAIGNYQAGKNLLADGQVNFQLYASLIEEDLRLSRRPAKQPELLVDAQQAAPANSLALALEPDRQGGAPYRVGDTLSITVQTNEDAFGYCYYRDGVGQVARLFPNRFQPDPLLLADKPVRIPGVNAQFDMVMEQAGASEEILCLASKQELGIKLPSALKEGDLVPLSMQSLAEVAQAFRSLDSSVVARTLSISVAR